MDMAYDYEVLDIKRIPIANLVIGKGYIRKTHVSRDISELAESIRAVGQLHPVIVCESADQPGKFEIITGLRRLLACKEIGQEDIWAMILDHPITEEEAKVISLTESTAGQPLDRKDLIDALTYLYNRYGDIKAVAKKTGLPPDKVRENVKYISLCQELRKLVDKGTVDMNTALRAQKALEAIGEVKPDVATTLAKKMQGMTAAQQVKVLKEVEKGGITTIREIDKLIKAVKKGKTYIEIRVVLGQEINEALARYALEAGVKREDAVLSIVNDALESTGYLGGEECEVYLQKTSAIKL